MNLQFIQRLYAATPLYERNVSPSRMGSIGRKPERHGNTYRKIPFAVVQDARRMHEQGMAAMQIVAELARQGHDVTPKSVRAWIAYQSRVSA